MSTEPGERLWRGPKGDRGDRGERGMPPGQRRAVIYLFTLNLLFVGLCFWGLIHYVQVNDQQRCASIAQIAAIPVPKPVAGNPSRMWESRYEAIQEARGRQLGCRIGGRP